MKAAVIDQALLSAGVAKPVSVVHLVLSLNIGGLEKVVYDLVRFANRDEFSTRVLCLGEIGALGPAFLELGIPVESLGVHGKGILRGIAAVARKLREKRPDVLHTHNPAAHIVGALAARWAGVPVVVHTRHGMHQTMGWTTTLGNRMATRLTHRMVAVSNAAAAMSRTNDCVSEDCLAVIRNGVDLNLYRQRKGIAPSSPLKNGDRSLEAASCANICDPPDADSESVSDIQPAARADFKAIHVARLAYPTKDQRTLLRAVRLIVDREPGFRLDIVGDGPDRTNLEALCDELELRSYVKFLGACHNIHDLLPQADLFVLTSTTEGLPMTLLEAMAAGLPIVSTDVGGISELVIQNETGLLVPPQSPDALAVTILDLLSDPKRFVKMGRAGRRRVEEEFDIRIVAARYEELYRSLLRRNRR